MAEAFEKGLKKIGITISRPILAMICIVFGLIVIVFPDFLSIIVGIFLIIQGILLITEYMELQRQQSSQPKPA